MRYALILGPLAALVTLACVGDDETERTVTPPATAAPASPTPEVTPTGIGSYDDPYDFRSFGEQIDTALRAGDVQFFLDNVTFEDVQCEGGEFPALPESCNAALPGSSVPAIIVGVEASEGYYADANQYEAVLREYLQGFVPDAVDRFGDGRPQLYAYSIAKQLRSPGGLTVVDAILTGIFPPAKPDAGPQRGVLVLNTSFDGAAWRVVGVYVAGPPYAVAFTLDPTGPETEPSGAELYKFWARWE